MARGKRARCDVAGLGYGRDGARWNRLGLASLAALLDAEAKSGREAYHYRRPN